MLTPIPSQLLAPRAAAHVVCWLGGGAMSVTGCLLLLALEHMPDTQSRCGGAGQWALGGRRHWGARGGRQSGARELGGHRELAGS